jgi:hypothetical protein
MRRFFQHPAVRRCRIIFRWCRICVWLTILLAVSLVAYFHLVGLPQFVKGPMLQRLKGIGIAAEFSNMELGWGPEPLIIIENASFSRAGQPLSPRLTARRGELELDWQALRHRRFGWNSLEVSDARLEVPVSETNGDSLVLDHVSLMLEFHSNNVVSISDCRGDFRGIRLNIIGHATHATEMQHWQFPGGGATTNVSSQERLRAIADTLDKIHLAGSPSLRIETGADGLDMNSFHANLNFTTSAAETPWGSATNLAFNASCLHLVNPGTDPFLEVRWSASNIKTRWAEGRSAKFSTILSRTANSNIVTDVQFEARRFSAPLDSQRLKEFTASRLSWKGHTTFLSSNLNPVLVTGELRAAKPRTPWASADDLVTEISGAPGPLLSTNHPDLGPFTYFAPWRFDWKAAVNEFDIPKFHVGRVSFAGHWLAPKVALENIQADLYRGHASLAATFDAASRELQGHGTTDFDPHAVSPLLRPPESNWLAQVGWTLPPKAKAGMRIILPPWTNRPPNWAHDVEDSLELGGDFTLGAGAYYPVTVDSASGHVAYTNRTWNVTGIHAVRADGEVDLDYISSPREFHYRIDSHMDPKAGMPLAVPSNPHLLDDLSFKQPPSIRCEIWGRWSDSTPYAVTASVRATNFMARGENVARFAAEAVFTNNLLAIRNFSVSNNQCFAAAPLMQMNCLSKIVNVTNVAGWIDPALLARILRTNAPGFLGLLHFDSPPTVSLSGSFCMTNSAMVDLRFLVGAGRIHYESFVANAATAEINWTGQTISITNIAAALYNKGSLSGHLLFNNPPAGAPSFQAHTAVKDIDLGALAVGLSGKKNRVEGLLDGDLDVSGTDVMRRQSWQGHGHMHAYNALLWDIKVFGLLSPVLNLFSPGWGYDRAREAQATYTITNGVLRSDDLVVRCTGFVLKFRGSVNNSNQINARVEAVLSRGVPLVGTLLSLAFTPVSKMMEYHISGTWTEPTMEPVFVPKFIMLMLHPFRSGKSSSIIEGPPTGVVSPAPASAPATK